MNSQLADTADTDAAPDCSPQTDTLCARACCPRCQRDYYTTHTWCPCGCVDVSHEHYIPKNLACDDAPMETKMIRALLHEVPPTRICAACTQAHATARHSRKHVCPGCGIEARYECGPDKLCPVCALARPSVLC